MNLVSMLAPFLPLSVGAAQLFWLANYTVRLIRLATMPMVITESHQEGDRVWVSGTLTPLDRTETHHPSIVYQKTRAVALVTVSPKPGERGKKSDDFVPLHPPKTTTVPCVLISHQHKLELDLSAITLPDEDHIIPDSVTPDEYSNAHPGVNLPQGVKEILLYQTTLMANQKVWVNATLGANIPSSNAETGYRDPPQQRWALMANDESPITLLAKAPKRIAVGSIVRIIILTCVALTLVRFGLLSACHSYLFYQLSHH